jgi:hypothetical protein
MNNLVASDDFDDESSAWLPPHLRPAARAQRRAELDVFRHGLRAAARAECDRQDGQAASDAIRASLDEELDLLEWGVHRANGSAAKTELVARKVNMLSQINDRRLTRRFGG